MSETLKFLTPELFLIIFNSNVKVKSNFKNFYNQISNINKIRPLYLF